MEEKIEILEKVAKHMKKMTPEEAKTVEIFAHGAAAASEVIRREAEKKKGEEKAS